MGQWLDPLLFFVADAAAQHNWALAARAMDSFSACIKYGSQLDVRPHSFPAVASGCAEHLTQNTYSYVYIEIDELSVRLHRCVTKPLIMYYGAVQADVATANVYPLLDRLAGEPDLLLRRSLLTAIAALALPGAATGELPEPVRERWSERVSLSNTCPRAPLAYPPSAL